MVRVWKDNVDCSRPPPGPLSRPEGPKSRSLKSHSRDHKGPPLRRAIVCPSPPLIEARLFPDHQSPAVRVPRGACRPLERPAGGSQAPAGGREGRWFLNSGSPLGRESSPSSLSNLPTYYSSPGVVSTPRVILQPPESSPSHVSSPSLPYLASTTQVISQALLILSPAPIHPSTPARCPHPPTLAPPRPPTVYCVEPLFPALIKSS
ncbi:extensin-like [Portunus trituberculatus]|uniref:extensin-like n=1 Tax=Portunus trituberculatus TaxID=210409 RepID=UPI001E1CDB96|nr:extensin-like [Portunus trituberculatus]